MPAELNKVFLIGNLTRDPELRYTGSGKAVCNFDLAVNQSYKDAASNETKKDTLFIKISVWNKMAEVCAEYLKKGSKVLVEGRLRMEKWESEGKTRTKIDVQAQRVQFLSARGAAPGEPVPEVPEEPEESQAVDDDIPF